MRVDSVQGVFGRSGTPRRSPDVVSQHTMTSPPSSDESIQTSERFATALERIVREAHRNGVDVEGGWECSIQDADIEYDVVVTRIGRRAETAEE